MYCFIYDDFVQERKHEKELAAVEARITDLGLQGKIVRLALFRNPDELIRDEVAGGVKTVVVVGNDETIHKVANAVVDSGAVLGIIPIGGSNILSKILGIPRGVEACDSLAKRNIESMDAGNINNHRFFTGVSFPSARAVVRCGSKYDMKTERRGEIEVRNLSVAEPKDATDISDPTDGKLEIVITTHVPRRFRKQAAVSRIPLKSFKLLFDEPVKVQADGLTLEGEEFSLTTESSALKVIVGKNRMF